MFFKNFSMLANSMESQPKNPNSLPLLTMLRRLWRSQVQDKRTRGVALLLCLVNLAYILTHTDSLSLVCPQRFTFSRLLCTVSENPAVVCCEWMVWRENRGEWLSNPSKLFPKFWSGDWLPAQWGSLLLFWLSLGHAHVRPTVFSSSMGVGLG